MGESTLELHTAMGRRDHAIFWAIRVVVKCTAVGFFSNRVLSWATIPFRRELQFHKPCLPSKKTRTNTATSLRAPPTFYLQPEHAVCRIGEESSSRIESNLNPKP